MADFYRARQSFAAPVGRSVQVIQEGHLVSGDDPLFRAHRDLFVPLAEYLERTTPPVESTTAAPGERRHARLPKGPPIRKEPDDAAPAAS